MDQIAVVVPLCNYADAAHNARRISKNLVRPGCDIVRATRANSFDGGDNALLLLIADALDGGVDLLRGSGSASGTIDMQNDCLDRVVICVAAQLRDHRFRFHDYAFEVDDGDLVSEPAAVFGGVCRAAQTDVQHGKDGEDKNE